MSTFERQCQQPLLPAHFKVPSMMDWWCASNVPAFMMFASQFSTTAAMSMHTLLAVADFRLQPDAEAKNGALLRCLDGLKRAYPAIGTFIGDKSGAAVVQALSAVAKHRTDISPLFEAVLTESILEALEAAIITLGVPFTNMKSSTMHDKLQVALKVGGSSLSTLSPAFIGSGSSGSKAKGELSGLDKLRLLPMFIDTQDLLADELRSVPGTVRRVKLFQIVFSSGCFALIKHMLGKGDQSALSETVRKLRPFCLPEFREDTLAGVAQAMAAVVLAEQTLDGLWELPDGLDDFAFSLRFVHLVLEGRWAEADFPLELYWLPEEHLRRRRRPFGDDRSDSLHWYVQGCSTTLAMYEETNKLPQRFNRLFTGFLHYPKLKPNGPESVMKALVLAVNAGVNDEIHGADIWIGANHFIYTAMREAGTEWRTVWLTLHADMPGPQVFLSTESKAANAMTAAMRSATKTHRESKDCPVFQGQMLTLMAGRGAVAEPSQAGAASGAKRQRELDTPEAMPSKSQGAKKPHSGDGRSGSARVIGEYANEVFCDDKILIYATGRDRHGFFRNMTSKAVRTYVISEQPLHAFNVEALKKEFGHELCLSALMAGPRGDPLSFCVHSADPAHASSSSAAHKHLPAARQKMQRMKEDGSFAQQGFYWTK